MVDNGALTVDGYSTGFDFYVTCSDGYTASAKNGVLICGENGQWVNNISCLGMIK